MSVTLPDLTITHTHTKTTYLAALILSDLSNMPYTTVLMSQEIRIETLNVKFYHTGRSVNCVLSFYFSSVINHISFKTNNKQ